MVVCRNVITELLFDYLEESLYPRLAAELEEHVRICAACPAYVATYRRTRQLATTAARFAVPADLMPRLRMFLAEKRTALPDS